MPWLEMAMKDVAICDKPRGADKQALIRGFPNGKTQCSKPALCGACAACQPAEVKHLSKRRKRKQALLTFVRSAKINKI